VLSRGGKPILGLIVLLAWPLLGLGGRAQASFSLGQLSRESHRPKCSLGFEFELVLNGEEQTEAAHANSPGGMSGETPSVPEADPAQRGFPQRPLPRPSDLQTGTSSGPAPSTGPGGGAGLSLFPPVPAPVLGHDVSGLLFLANERLKPPPFPSRLFRPPR